MNPQKRRVSGRKLLAWVLTLILLPAGGFLIWVGALIARNGRAMDLRISRLETLARSMRSPRAVLRGEPLSGSAWGDYEEAINRVSRVPMRSSELRKFVLQEEGPDRQVAAAEVVAHEEALSILRKGVRHEEAGPHSTVTNEEGPIYLELIGMSKARLLEEAGRRHDAAELLLDLCQFNGDLGRSLDWLNEIWSASLGSVLHQALRRVLLEGDLSPNDLAQFDGELAKLELASPTQGASVLAYTARVGAEDFRNRDSLQGWLEGIPIPWAAGWRYAFSIRLIMADAFEHYARDAENFAAADRQPWKRLVLLEQETAKRSSESLNPLVRQRYFGGVMLRDWRGLQTQFRLLRLAVHYRATGVVLDLEDPLGTRLQSDRKQGRIILWSRGRDDVPSAWPSSWSPRMNAKPFEIKIPE